MSIKLSQNVVEQFRGVNKVNQWQQVSKERRNKYKYKCEAKNKTAGLMKQQKQIINVMYLQ